ncbi:hypothetical protein CEXT_202881 [Caerostris extrusa]|uniref:Uncharacterized protein n=1 Tax=Caerostris extrusa TaxID=172846 RepID=A0AAV4VCN5_CAEEX|nr:hypothetical protein CEXT_202881 [Caerostris extrusa]
MVTCSLSYHRPPDNVAERALAMGRKHKETLEGLDKSIECGIKNDDELEEEIEGSLEYTESIVLCKSRVNRYLGNLNKLQELSSLNLSNVTTESEKES